jgi:hypothetical protein
MKKLLAVLTLALVLGATGSAEAKRVKRLPVIAAHNHSIWFANKQRLLDTEPLITETASVGPCFRYSWRKIGCMAQLDSGPWNTGQEAPQGIPASHYIRCEWWVVLARTHQGIRFSTPSNPEEAGDCFYLS